MILRRLPCPECHGARWLDLLPCRTCGALGSILQDEQGRTEPPGTAKDNGVVDLTLAERQCRPEESHE